MTFKTLQVLRTKVPLKTEDGKQISPGTRVVVLGMNEDGQARTKVVDVAHATLKDLRVTAATGAFNKTHRGRPRKTA